MKRDSFFVTGTGTGVGKTLVSAVLLRELRERGETPRALKPVISGYPDPEGPSDSEVLLLAAGRDGAVAEIEAISPWRFRAPLSPDMAARRENRKIDFEALVAFSREAVSGDARERVLIEGVGGVCVPLDTTHTVLDWMAACGLPAILVAGSYLGTLSHTLSAVTTLSGRGIGVQGIVVSASPESPVSLEETRATLRNFLDPPIPVALLPRLEGARPWAQAPSLCGALGI